MGMIVGRMMTRGFKVCIHLFPAFKEIVEITANKFR